MRIAMITPVYVPYASGMAHVAAHHVDVAKNAGYQVRIITPHYRTTFPPLPDVVYMQSRFMYGNAAYISSFEQYFSPDTDLIHFHAPFIGAVNALTQLVKKYPHIPVLTTYHMDLVASGIKGLFFKMYNRRALPKIAKLSTTIHVSSEDYFNHSILAHVVDRKKIIALPLGIDTERFQYTTHTESFLRAHHISSNGKIILFVGSLDKAHLFKGIPVLLNAFVHALKSHNDLYLVIAGKGSMQQTYIKQAMDLEIIDYVRFVGFVADADMPALYSSALCTVLPSTSYSEAFGLVLLESQSCGTPVIASDLPGVRTVVDPKSGLLVNPGNETHLAEQIIQILDTYNSAQNSAMVRISAATFIRDHFDATKIQNQLLELYKMLKKK